MGEEKGEGKGVGMFLGWRAHPGVLWLECFKGWGFRGGLREGSQWNIPQLFQVYPFWVVVSTDWSLVIQAGPGLVLLLF